MSRRLALFGGSFDPVHRGHVEPVLEARDRLALDEILYLPTATPPHKGPRSAPALARYAMVELAVLREPRLAVSGHEMEPGRPAYTVDTLEWFRAREPEAELFLVLGADSLLGLPTWRRWQDILRLAHLIVLGRPGWQVAADDEALLAPIRQSMAAGRVELLDNRRWELSSTELREGLARGEEPSAEAFPPLVVDYLAKYRPYR